MEAAVRVAPDASISTSPQERGARAPFVGAPPRVVKGKIAATFVESGEISLTNVERIWEGQRTEAGRSSICKVPYCR